jgi:transcriptional regulator with XRE-family HTH domain
MQEQIFSSETFSRALNRAMEEKGWNQKDLARHSGLSQPSISRYINGSTEPKLSDLGLLAQCLGISLDALAGRPPTQLAPLPPPTSFLSELRLCIDRAQSAETTVSDLKESLEHLIKKL